MPRSATRSEKLDLRITAEAKHTLVTAAASLNRSVSDFVLESALSRAAETLPDREHFLLDDAKWSAFQEALDAPVRHLPRLKQLLTERSTIERDGK